MFDKCPACNKADSRRGVIVPAYGDQYVCAYCNQYFLLKEGKLIKVNKSRENSVPERHIGTIHSLHEPKSSSHLRKNLSQTDGDEPFEE